VFCRLEWFAVFQEWFAVFCGLQKVICGLPGLIVFCCLENMICGLLGVICGVLRSWESDFRSSRSDLRCFVVIGGNLRCSGKSPDRITYYIRQERIKFPDQFANILLFFITNRKPPGGIIYNVYVYKKWRRWIFITIELGWLVILSKQRKTKMCNGRRHVPLCPASANEK